MLTIIYILQANLLELKNQNYTLEDQCRKQKNALGEAQAKITVFEKELTNARKVIAKSKKAQEVKDIIKTNESLQSKLRCQEEEFRIQNQTLLQELSKVGSGGYSTTQAIQAWPRLKKNWPNWPR